MGLLEQLCGLVSQRRALLESAPPPPFEAMLSTMHSKSGVLADELAATEARIATTFKEHQEKEVERGMCGIYCRQTERECVCVCVREREREFC
jgi:hypothetical protein